MNPSEINYLAFLQTLHNHMVLKASELGSSQASARIEGILGQYLILDSIQIKRVNHKYQATYRFVRTSYSGSICDTEFEARRSLLKRALK